MAYAHFPQLPIALFFLYLLGLPGMYIEQWIFGEFISNFGIRLLVATLFAWILYFALFRILIVWHSRQQGSSTKDEAQLQGGADDQID